MEEFQQLRRPSSVGEVLVGFGQEAKGRQTRRARRVKRDASDPREGSVFHRRHPELLQKPTPLGVVDSSEHSDFLRAIPLGAEALQAHQLSRASFFRPRNDGVGQPRDGPALGGDVGVHDAELLASTVRPAHDGAQEDTNGRRADAVADNGHRRKGRGDHGTYLSQVE